MRIFNEWLTESKLMYDKNNVYDLIGVFETITDIQDHYIDELVNDIYYKKKDAVKKYFSKFDEPLKLLKSKLSSISNPIEKKNAMKAIESFKEIKKGYFEFEKNLKDILNVVKVGESKETAIKKLVNMTKTAKYYSLSELKYSGTYFDEYSEYDIEKMIFLHDGLAKFNGSTFDLYVKFNENTNKVEKVYF